MNNAFIGFYLIKNSTDAGKDCISAFIPLLVHLFSVKDYSSVDVEKICNDFETEFSIRLPRHPMETILNKMKPTYIKKEGGHLQIIKQTIKEQAKLIDINKEEKKFHSLIKDFINYCNNFSKNININVDFEEADDLLVSYFRNHDLDIVFASYANNGISLLPKDTSDHPDKTFLVNKYINELMEKGGELCNYLVDCAIGHNYASTILYREFLNIRGKGICANCYLDIGILFDITGINGKFRKESTEEFLKYLTSKGSKLKLFQHNYDEFLRIIDGAKTWIESKNYDYTKASRALRYFIDRGNKKNDIDIFMQTIPSLLTANRIDIIQKPDPNQDQFYQIDRTELQKVIIETYNNDGHYADLDEKESTLELDIDSIESIYKIRKGRVPINLNQTEHVFVTANSGLALASKIFDKKYFNRDYFVIPTVVTDVFLGTMVWINEPSNLAETYSRSKIIAYTNAAIQPNHELIRSFVREVKKAQEDEENPISDENAALLITSKIAIDLLADNTMLNSERISSQTPYEVLNDLKITLSEKERQKTDEAETEKRKIQDLLNQEKDKNKELFIEIEEKKEKEMEIAKRIAKLVKKFLILVGCLVLIGAIVFTVVKDNLIARIVSGIIGLLGLSIAGIITFSKKIEQKLYDRIILMFTKKIA